MRQLGWTEGWRFGMSWSKGPYWKRFCITKTTTGYTVVDSKAGDLVRVRTLAAARAWAGIRVGERDVRHGA